MGNSTLHIKNMVCPRCVETVQEIFRELHIPIISVRLGEVITSSNLTKDQQEKLGVQLDLRGFELLQDQKSKLISRIKTIIVEQIHHSDQPLNTSFSTLLADTLNHEYTWLSKLFSSVEGVTLERFILKQKTERVKELIFYNELTLSEIAFQVGYSSAAHLSSQFKKETGMTPGAFRKIKRPEHRSLDTL